MRRRADAKPSALGPGNGNRPGVNLIDLLYKATLLVAGLRRHYRGQLRKSKHGRR
jgi:hypothetical protein